MLRKKKIKLLKNKYKQIYIVSNKIKHIILKSIFFNRNIKTQIRAFSYLKLNSLKLLNLKYHKICKFSSYSKSINKFVGLGRHEVNRKAILGKLQNINVNSW